MILELFRSEGNTLLVVLIFPSEFSHFISKSYSFSPPRTLAVKHRNTRFEVRLGEFQFIIY